MIQRVINTVKMATAQREMQTRICSLCGPLRKEWIKIYMPKEYARALDVLMSEGINSVELMDMIEDYERLKKKEHESNCSRHV